MRVFVDIDEVVLRGYLKLFIGNSTAASISTTLEDADVVLGPSHRSYTKPSIKFSDTVGQLYEDDLCVSVVPFPTSLDNLTYIKDAIECLNK